VGKAQRASAGDFPAGDRLRLVQTRPASPAAHDQLVALGFEGSVLRRPCSTYRPGRQTTWRKYKASHRASATLRALRPGRDGYTYAISALDGRCVAGVWEPPAPPDRDADRAQTFHVLASRWWAAWKGELRPRTRENYEWRLRKHLLPFFADHAISEIDVGLVEPWSRSLRFSTVRSSEAVWTRTRHAASAAGSKPSSRFAGSLKPTI
jgi:hypothetical protein